MDGGTVSGALGAFSTVISEVWTQMSSCLTTIKGEPILLAPTAIGFVGGIMGITKSFIRFGRRK